MFVQLFRYRLMVTASQFSVERMALSLKHAMDFVGSRVVNREEVIKQCFLALLTGEHVLLQSRTGVAKSLLAEQIFAMFTGARIFRVQASKEQQPDTYFGGLDIEQLKTGRIIHNTEGSLVDSEFGFIDEIFDANDFTLRALLSVLNERRLIRGVQNVAASIHTVIAATNYLRVNEVTEAILDRFLYKSIILPDKDPLVQFKISAQYSQHSAAVLTPKDVISMADLKRLRAMLNGTDPSFGFAISAETLYFYNLVIRHYEYARNRALRDLHKGQSAAHFDDFYISPRTQAKALDLVRAIAFLDGRTLARAEDAAELFYMFATVGQPEEVSVFKKSYQTVYKALNTGNGFEQVRMLLAYESLILQIEKDPAILAQPLDKVLSMTQLRRTLLEWIQETFGGDQTVHHNKKVLQKFLHDLIPVCDEVRELKHALERETTQIFQKIEN